MCSDEERALRARVTALESAISTLVAILKRQGHREAHYPRVTRADRQRVTRRDRSTCRYCGLRLHPSDVTIDHIQPRSRGGSNDPSNLVVACRDCQNAKGDKPLSDCGLSLK